MNLFPRNIIDKNREVSPYDGLTPTEALEKRIYELSSRPQPIELRIVEDQEHSKCDACSLNDFCNLNSTTTCLRENLVTIQEEKELSKDISRLAQGWFGAK